jgi:hypothetical protein
MKPSSTRAGDKKDPVKLIQEKNIKNILKKLADGKTISEREEVAVARYYEEQGLGTLAYAGNQVELAEQLGVDRRTIARWMKIKGRPQPRSNGRHSVLDWRTWAEKTGRKLVEDDDQDSERGRLELRRLRTICERLELDFEVAKGNYIANEEVEIMVRRMVSVARKHLSLMPSQLAPQLAGLTIAEIEERVKVAIDEVLQQLHSGKWEE